LYLNSPGSKIGEVVPAREGLRHYGRWHTGKVGAIGEVVPAREGLRPRHLLMRNTHISNRRSGSSKRRIKTSSYTSLLSIFLYNRRSGSSKRRIKTNLAFHLNYY